MWERSVWATLGTLDLLRRDRRFQDRVYVTLQALRALQKKVKRRGIEGRGASRGGLTEGPQAVVEARRESIPGGSQRRCTPVDPPGAAPGRSETCRKRPSGFGAGREAWYPRIAVLEEASDGPEPAGATLRIRFPSKLSACGTTSRPSPNPRAVSLPARNSERHSLLPPAAHGRPLTDT